MALDNLLDQLATFNLDAAKPVIPWQLRDFDGFEVRNEHERALGDRDQVLLELLQATAQHGSANVSPQYPFTEVATLKPSQATCYDNAGAVMTTFTVNPAPLALTNSFLSDLKLIITNEFREPFLSKIILRKAVDPETALVQVFVDLEVSARYTGDQQDHVILKLTDKAYNDVQDNTAPSSRDELAFDLAQQNVDARTWLNSGIVRFHFLGSVQSGLSTSWSVGTYGTAVVEGFSAVAALARIEFTFTRPATALTELSYDRLGDLQSAVPFLDKIRHYPFDIAATAGGILTKYVKDITITGPPWQKVSIRRIRRKMVGGYPQYLFLFSYIKRDTNGNYLNTVNIGLATVTNTSGPVVPITSLASNMVIGVDPTWIDEVPTTYTTDNYGVGRLKITAWEDLQALFDELVGAPVIIGSPSPITVSPVSPEPITGLFADPNVIEMIEDNSILDTLVVSIQGKSVSVYAKPPGTSQATNNTQVLLDGVLVNRRCCYGVEGIMRDFYGIPSTESLVDNTKIPLEDEWFDTSINALKRYQIVQGHRRWRSL